MQGDTITLPSQLPIVGDAMVNEWVLLAILTVIVAAFTIGAMVPLLAIFRRLDRSVATVKNDAGFQAEVAAIQKRRKAVIKEYTQLSPPGPVPSHERLGWSVISTSLLIGLFLAFAGAAFSNDFQGGDNALWYSLGFAAVGTLAGLAFLNRKRIQATQANESSPLSGGVIWVVVTGLIVIGLGVGVMMWVRTVGA